MSTSDVTLAQHRRPAPPVRGRRVERYVRWAGVVLAALLILQFLLLPIGLAVVATRDAHRVVGNPPAGFEIVTLTTADGVRLAGWYAPPENGAAILLLHGAGDSRDEIRPYIQILVENGFGVLALDLRGHGESEGRTNRVGWRGTEDVQAAVDFLSRQDEVQAIGGLGLSLGGEVLLGAASANPALTAIVSEGATARSLAEFRAIPSHRNPLASLQPWIFYTAVAFLTGETPPPPLLESIQAAEQTHLLLLAAKTIRDEVEFNTYYAEAAPGRAELWVVPAMGHTGAYVGYTDLYEQRVVNFYRKTLLESIQK